MCRGFESLLSLPNKIKDLDENHPPKSCCNVLQRLPSNINGLHVLRFIPRNMSATWSLSMAYAEEEQLVRLEGALIGKSCVVRRREGEWVFDLSDDTYVSVSVPWRVVANGRIALSSEDDGQMFGRGSPLNCETEALTVFRWKNYHPRFRGPADRPTSHSISMMALGSMSLTIRGRYEGWLASYLFGPTDVGQLLL